MRFGVLLISCRRATHTSFPPSSLLGTPRHWSHPASRVCASVRGKIIPDYFAILHHESNSLQLANVGDWISSNCDEIGKSPRLDSAHVVLPAQHFRGVGRDCANDVERRH